MENPDVGLITDRASKPEFALARIKNRSPAVFMPVYGRPLGLAFVMTGLFGQRSALAAPMRGFSTPSKPVAFVVESKAAVYLFSIGATAMSEQHTPSLLLKISNVPVRQDSAGRFSLNDLHKAAGGYQKLRPKYWLENHQTKELIGEMEKGGIPPISTSLGRTGGTYVAKELVYAYAMWISPAFHLKVIRAYDAMATQPHPGELSRLQLLEIALQAEQERLELAQKLGQLEARLDSIERHAAPELPKPTATSKRLYTVKQNVEAYPAFKEGGLRHLIFHADGHKPNGFGACIRRIGRKVLIDADRFEAWIEQH